MSFLAVLANIAASSLGPCAVLCCARTTCALLQTSAFVRVRMCARACAFAYELHPTCEHKWGERVIHSVRNQTL